MKHIAMAEVTEQLPSLLDDVARGEEITITRDGKPVARLVPTALDLEPVDVEQRRAAIKRLREMAERRGGNFSHEEIKSWIEEGRH